jgi:hypothetical protein
MPNGQDPGTPPQKPGSASGADTGTGTGGETGRGSETGKGSSTGTGSVTGTGAGSTSGAPGKIKPLDDDRPPQKVAITAAVMGLIDRVIGDLLGAAYCANE